ncbi:alpha/beta fold hydrolase [Streptomyces sp. NPDC004610]|uniref:thioesterase II family protein n=1 Tax=unclassified Streptomyces TaxID=2593676 RepID=UPI0033B4A1C9
MVRRRPREGAPGLFCFAHSGGSAGEFARWAAELPDVEIRAVQLPGRGTRIDEPVLTDMRTLVTAIVDEVSFEGRFAFFGHSLGALVAYEVARELRRRGSPGPERLFLSACPAPHLRRSLPPIRQLDDTEMLAAISGRYGTLPADIAEDPELLRLVMVPHRADFTIVETYGHTSGEPLSVPLHLVAGAADRVTAEQLEAWREHSRGPVDVRWLPGGHFYLREQRAALLAHVRDLLAPVPGPGGAPEGAA